MTILTFLSLWAMMVVLMISVVRADDLGNFDWKNWNYYEILGLTSPPSTLSTSDGHKKPLSRRKRISQRNKITKKDIKRAYRREAQLWHPDKWLSRFSSSSQMKNQTDVNDSNTPTSMEECTERFARIAQAYELLTDDFNRMEYDLNLLDLEDEQQRQQQQQQQGNYDKKPSLMEKFAMKDPRKIFEEFFFGEESLFTKSNGIFQSVHDFLNDFGDDNNQQQQSAFQKDQKYSKPIRVTESTQIRYDTRLGRDIHRILHREEYYYSESETYFRIIAQEFIQEDSYYYQQGSSDYVPITDPYLLEDGFVPVINSQKSANAKRNPSSDKQQRQQQKPSIQRQSLSHESSILDSNEYITPNSRYFLRSPNKQYYAGLTPNCELIVMMDNSNYKQRNDGELREDKLIWTSNSYLPPSFTDHHNTQCYLAIYNSMLAVVVGPDADDPISVLWNTPQPKNIYYNIKHLFQNHHDKNSQKKQENELEYYLSLDNDGSLTLYRVRNDSSSSTKTTLTEKISSWWALINDDYGNDPKIKTTRAAAAWKSIQSWAIQKVNRFHYLHSMGKDQQHNSGHSQNKKEECIFSTSPVGCFTPGRQVLYMGKNAKRSLDIHVDGFVEMLQAEDEDEDILDTFTRVVGKVGDAVGKASIRMAKQSARDIRVATRIVSDLIREQIRFLKKSINAIEN